MGLSFVKLEWKSFIRATSFKANLVIKIILGLGAVFYSILILLLGVSAFYALQEEGLEPLETINHYLIYWWVFDLLFRYFLQKTPVMWIRPLLAQPISKKRITRYLLGKSAFSFFNIYPVFFFLPFSITLLFNGYSVGNVILWHLAIVSISYFNNYLNLAINNKDWVFAVVVSLLGLLGGLHYFNFIDLTQYSLLIFQSFYAQPLSVIPIVLLLMLMYWYNYTYFFKSLYLDDAIKVKSKAAKINDYSWLNRFGLMGTFLKNDVRLILRNKRSKNTLWISVFFLFYGLLILTNDMYKDSLMWLVFVGIFVSGGFLFTFGGFVPSWDSAYYPFMMSQNIKYKEYLASKWWLIVVATLLSMVLSVFYLFINPNYYFAILAGGIYNIGVNAYIVLLSGAFVKSPIDLSTGNKPFGDKKAFNIKTLLLTIPKILLPIAIFYLFNYFWGINAGFLAIVLSGFFGLLFRNPVFRLIEKVYKHEKYDTIQAYKQKG